MIVTLPDSLIDSIAAWREDRDRVNALENEGDPYPAASDWYASDDWAVEIVNQIEDIIIAEDIITEGGEK